MSDNQHADALSTIPPHPVKYPLALTLLTILVVCSAILLVIGVAMFALDSAPVLVRVLAILAGLGLTVWFGWRLSRGAGRRTPVITSSTPMHITALAAFGLPMGFSLFQLLTSDQSPVTIGMFATALVGMVTSLVAFVRDVDLLDVPIELVVLPSAGGDISTPQTSQAAAEITPVAFDPTPVHRFSDDEEEPSALLGATEVSSGGQEAAGSSAPATPEYAFDKPEYFDSGLEADEPSPTDTARRRALPLEEDDTEEATPAAPRRAARRGYFED